MQGVGGNLAERDFDIDKIQHDVGNYAMVLAEEGTRLTRWGS